MKKLFTEIFYDSKLICWGHGNNLISPNLIARINFKANNKIKDKKMLNEYQLAEKNYNKYINKGQLFKAKDRNIICRINFINNNKESITWKQINLNKEEALILKAAKGNFNICGFINMIKTKQIEIL